MNSSKRCATGSQNRVNNGIPSIEYQTIICKNAGAANTVDRDIPVAFSKPYSFIFVASIQLLFRGSGVYLHFNKLGLPTAAAGNVITPDGSEQWIPLSNNAATGNAASCEGRWLRFPNLIQSFFIDADHPAGVQAGGYKITFGGTNDIDLLVAERQ